MQNKNKSDLEFIMQQARDSADMYSKKHPRHRNNQEYNAFLLGYLTRAIEDYPELVNLDTYPDDLGQ